ncbi:exopolysaccharide biosynthesis polyprenyl glycosylphosphotransferase [Flavobacterium franklandianum]|uniref:Exopolysaccharide biosynthesis polyprenyl glycosylphosphotransferase n=1 Tax=Flavobacterium franklandianum TaxID=2594430 RepID=A0A553CT79_9FLAO|nr:exopolysaccharide biosynthesis polyprenyl glycosylphosphotransferase [Flavobacterium franklandianum]TRX23738.1 exopolysaccharide biosynthesis polyprenyl glycosylphosphotransferase [Flavobacterium franklandianum]TRX26959.1 exopolysaccharide biosynthesis polyprenyl glycosylphosphotransferase [Flavobacterium franklandianum]
MKTKTGRYSGYIRPFSYLIDLIIINVLTIYMFPFHSNEIIYSILISLAWIAIAIYLGFYEVYRYTKVIAILNCALKQFVLFSLFCLALELFYSDFYYQKRVVFFVVLSIIFILLIKLSIYYFLRKFRVLYGGNSRSVVLLGNNKNISPLKNFFTENPDYGYRLMKVFTLENHKNEKIDECFSYVITTKTDEIYCAMADLSDSQITDIIDFADNNLKTLKFIPDEKQILSRTAKFEYYNYIPVISLRNILQDETINKVIKRIFDLLFSSIIIIGLMSWIMPILAIIIKLESKGPLFFIQKRNGLNYKEFNCYKFRSMFINDQADTDLASKNDVRITKVGKFIRKTSIDELPQFFNVFLGEMSVVGPRPHMVSVANLYALKVDKFMVRHFVKPGITGLAQTKGYRGEVETDEDIINRVKYDIFYMENWSILLDIEIIFKTIYNVLKGDEKAF